MLARTLILLAILLHPVAYAQEAGTTSLLKPLQFLCDDFKSLEILLDRKDKRPNDGLLELMYNSGVFCMPTNDYQRVFRVRNLHGDKHKYVCYQLWDVTRPDPPKENEQVFCSEFGAITTMAELVKTRSGHFSIEQHEKYDHIEFAVANCHEGGRIHVKRQTNAWERSSNLPINAPRKGFGEPVLVDGSLDDVLRDGCRAKDYQ